MNTLNRTKTYTLGAPFGAKEQRRKSECTRYKMTIAEQATRKFDTLCSIQGDIPTRTFIICMGGGDGIINLKRTLSAYS